MSMKFTDPKLEAIREKMAAGARLDAEDGMALFETPDFLGLGRMANGVKESITGDQAFFILNRQLNPTNLCALSCKFCDFAAKPGDAHAYEMSWDEIFEACSGDIHEVHIVGGLYGGWSFDKYIEIVRRIKAKRPDVRLKAYTAVEIDFIARLGRKSIQETLRILKDAGVDALPGGGAEVFSERVKKELFAPKIGADRWLEIHEAAHREGIPSNCTMLYGHIETAQERVDHILRLRGLQDKTGGFLSFIPLAFQPGATGITTRRASAIEDLRVIAVSRLLLDNFKHIKAYWAMSGLETAAMALNFGADDLDGTLGKETIAHMAGATSPEGLARDSLIRVIRDAGRVPVQRDIFYNAVAVHAA